MQVAKRPIDLLAGRPGDRPIELPTRSVRLISLHTQTRRDIHMPTKAQEFGEVRSIPSNASPANWTTHNTVPLVSTAAIEVVMRARDPSALVPWLMAYRRWDLPVGVLKLMLEWKPIRSFIGLKDEPKVANQAMGKRSIP